MIYCLHEFLGISSWTLLIPGRLSGVGVGSAYGAPMILFPLLQPLWRWLANRFPDVKLQRLLDARRSVMKTSIHMLQRERERLERERLAEGSPRVEPLRNTTKDIGGGVTANGPKGVAPGSFFQIAMQAKRRDGGKQFPDMDLCQQVRIWEGVGILSYVPSARKTFCVRCQVSCKPHWLGAKGWNEHKVWDMHKSYQGLFSLWNFFVSNYDCLMSSNRHVWVDLQTTWFGLHVLIKALPLIY